MCPTLVSSVASFPTLLVAEAARSHTADDDPHNEDEGENSP